MIQGRGKLIHQLGLMPLRNIRAQTANGTIDRTVYSQVKYTVLERSDFITVTDLPEDAPVLVGHMILKALNLCVDIQNGLIYNPAHDGAWMIKILLNIRTSMETAVAHKQT